MDMAAEVLQYNTINAAHAFMNIINVFVNNPGYDRNVRLL
jgi:hypothetical protein